MVGRLARAVSDRQRHDLPRRRYRQAMPLTAPPDLAKCVRTLRSSIATGCLTPFRCFAVLMSVMATIVASPADAADLRSQPPKPPQRRRGVPLPLLQHYGSYRPSSCERRWPGCGSLSVQAAAGDFGVEVAGRGVAVLVFLLEVVGPVGSSRRCGGGRGVLRMAFRRRERSSGRAGAVPAVFAR